MKKPLGRLAVAGPRQNWTLPSPGGGAGRAGAGLAGCARGRGGSRGRATGTTAGSAGGGGGGRGAASGTRGGISHPPATRSAAAVPPSRTERTRASAIGGRARRRIFGRRVSGRRIFGRHSFY